MRLIDSVIISLIDGNWHSIEEVLKCLGDNNSKTLSTLMFLWKFGFVDVDGAEEHMKLSCSFARFMADVGRIQSSDH